MFRLQPNNTHQVSNTSLHWRRGTTVSMAYSKPVVSYGNMIITVWRLWWLLFHTCYCMTRFNDFGCSCGLSYVWKVLHDNLQYNLSILYGNKVLNFYVSYVIRILLILSEYTRHLVLKYSSSTLPILYVCFPYHIFLYVTPTYNFHSKCSYMTCGTRVLYNHT